MYSKIALSNVKKSIRDYTIYFLTLTFGICLFYMFNSVQAQQAVLKLNASQKSMMHLMSVIINGIFCVCCNYSWISDCLCKSVSNEAAA